MPSPQPGMLLFRLYIHDEWTPYKVHKSFKVRIVCTVWEFQCIVEYHHPFRDSIHGGFTKDSGNRMESMKYSCYLEANKVLAEWGLEKIPYKNYYVREDVKIPEIKPVRNTGTEHDRKADQYTAQLHAPSLSGGDVLLFR